VVKTFLTLYFTFLFAATAAFAEIEETKVRQEGAMG